MKTLLIGMMLTQFAFSSALFAGSRTDSTHDDLDLDEVSIKSVIAGGTGCRGGEGAFAFVEDGILSVDAMDMYVGTGPSFTKKDMRKFCQFMIKLDVPSGYAVSIGEAEGEVVSYLLRGVQGKTNLSVSERGGFDKGSLHVKSNKNGYSYKGFNKLLSEEVLTSCGAKKVIKVKLSMLIKKLRVRTSSGNSAMQLSAPISLPLELHSCD